MLRRLSLAVLLLAGPAFAAERGVPARDLLMTSEGPGFRYSWRAAPEAAAHPALLRQLRAAATVDIVKLRADAVRDRARTANARTERPAPRLQKIVDWSRAADTPHLLALTSETYSFTGGAHGNTGFAALLWDKRGRRPIKLSQLFTDWAKARKLVEAGYCTALAEQQALRRRGERLGNDFDRCPRLSDQVMSPWSRGADGGVGQVQMLLAPYEAGPYAEGSYTVTLPWPAAIKPLVKPGYRSDLFPGG